MVYFYEKNPRAHIYFSRFLQYNYSDGWKIFQFWKRWMGCWNYFLWLMIFLFLFFFLLPISPQIPSEMVKNHWKRTLYNIPRDMILMIVVTIIIIWLLLLNLSLLWNLFHIHVNLLFSFCYPSVRTAWVFFSVPNITRESSWRHLNVRFLRCFFFFLLSFCFGSILLDGKILFAQKTNMYTRYIRMSANSWILSSPLGGLKNGFFFCFFFFLIRQYLNKSANVPASYIDINDKVIHNCR